MLLIIFSPSYLVLWKPLWEDHPLDYKEINRTFREMQSSQIRTMRWLSLRGGFPVKLNWKGDYKQVTVSPPPPPKKKGNATLTKKKSHAYVTKNINIEYFFFYTKLRKKIWSFLRHHVVIVAFGQKKWIKHKNKK